MTIDQNAYIYLTYIKIVYIILVNLNKDMYIGIYVITYFPLSHACR